MKMLVAVTALGAAIALTGCGASSEPAEPTATVTVTAAPAGSFPRQHYETMLEYHGAIGHQLTSELDTLDEVLAYSMGDEVQWSVLEARLSDSASGFRSIAAIESPDGGRYSALILEMAEALEVLGANATGLATDSEDALESIDTVVEIARELIDVINNRD